MTSVIVPVSVPNTAKLNFSRNYCCPNCSFTTQKSKVFLYHLIDVHKENFVIFDCDLCDYASRYKQKMLRHRVLRHKGAPPFADGRATGSPLLGIKTNEIDMLPTESTSSSKKSRRKPAVVRRVSQTVQSEIAIKAETGEIEGESDDDDEDLKKYVQFQPITEHIDETAEDADYVLDTKSGSFSEKKDNYSRSYRNEHDKNDHVVMDELDEEEDIVTCIPEDNDQSELSSMIDLSDEVNGANFACLRCTFMSDQRKDVIRHIQNFHGNHKSYSCDNCDFVTTRRLDFCLHKTKHSDKNVYSCHACQYYTTLKANLDRHLLNHGGEGQFQCKFCNYTSSSSGGIRAHESHYHSGTYNNTKHTMQPTAMMHQSHSPSPDIQDNLKPEVIHEVVTNYEATGSPSSSQLNTVCPECGYKARSPAKLQDHMLSHSKISSFTCNVCGLKYRRSSDLNRHMKQKHGVKLREYIDKRKLEDSSDAEQPVDLSVKKPRLETPPCDRDSPSPTPLNPEDFTSPMDGPLDLSVHQKMENNQDVSPYEILKPEDEELGEDLKCQYCNYLAKWPSDLRRHLKVHSLEKRYRCRVCLKKYKYLGDVNSHMRKVHGIYTSEMRVTKPKVPAGQFICHYCNYVALYQSQLERHIRLHTGEKPYKCVFCDYKSSWRGDLKRHIEKHHGDCLNKGRGIEEIMQKIGDDVKANVNRSPPEGVVPNKNDLHAEGMTMEDTSIGDIASESQMELQDNMQRPDGGELHCSYCPYTARAPSKLKAHVAIHENLKIFKCPDCGQRANWKWDIQKHIRKEHPHSTSQVICLSEDDAKATLDTYMASLGKGNTSVYRHQFYNSSASHHSQDTQVNGEHKTYTSPSDHERHRKFDTCSESSRDSADIQSVAADLSRNSHVKGEYSQERDYQRQSSGGQYETESDDSRDHHKHFDTRTQIKREIEEDHVLDFSRTSPMSHMSDASETPSYTGYSSASMNRDSPRLAPSPNTSISSMQALSPALPSGGHNAILSINRPIPGRRSSGYPQGDDRPYRCTKCNRRSNWKWDLKKHIERCHPNDPGVKIADERPTRMPYRCTKCSMRANNETELSQHIEEHHSGENDAEISFDRSALYVTSGDSSSKQYTFHNATPESEGSCSTRLPGITKDNDTRPYKCSVCDRRSNWNSDINRHIRIKHPNANAVVMRMWDTETPPKIEMSTAPSSCSSPRVGSVPYYPAPAIKEDDRRPFMCSQCGKRSNWKWDINKHIRGMHPGTRATCMAVYDNTTPILVRKTPNTSSDKTSHKADLFTSPTFSSPSMVPSSRIIDTLDMEDADRKIKQEPGTDQAQDMSQSNSSEGYTERRGDEYVDNSSSSRSLYKCSLCPQLSQWSNVIKRHVISRHPGGEVRMLRIPPGGGIGVPVEDDDTHSDEGPEGDLMIDETSVVMGDNDAMEVDEVQNGNKPKDNRPFKCSLCNRRSNWKWDLKKHIRHVHAGTDAEVIEMFSRGAGLSNMHVETIVQTSGDVDDKPPTHTDTYNLKRFKCSGCQYRSNWRSDIWRHIQRKHSKDVKIIVLSRTEAAETLMDYLKIAKRKFTFPSGTLWKCRKCFFRKENRTEVLEHVKNVHDGEGVDDEIVLIASADNLHRGYHDSFENNLHDDDDDACENMDEDLHVDTTEQSSPQEMGKNMLNHHHSFQCSLCGMTSNFKNELYRHLREKHATMDYNLCIEGEFPPHSKNINGIMSTIAQKERKYKCTHCPYQTDKPQQFEYHNTCHRRQPGNKYKCQYCPYWLSVPRLMHQHIRLHLQNQDWEPQEEVNERHKDIPDTVLSLSQSDHSMTNPDKYSSEPTNDSPRRTSQNAEDNNNLPKSGLSIQKPKDTVAMAMTLSQDKQPEDLSTNHNSSSENIIPSPTGNDDSSVYNCDKCPFSTSQRDNLLKHLSYHKKNYTCTCSLCSYSAPTMELLEEHERVHFENRKDTGAPLTNGVHDDNHNDPVDLTKPTEVPNTTQPENLWICQYCDRSFSASELLLKHEMQHLATDSKAQEDVEMTTT